MVKIDLELHSQMSTYGYIIVLETLGKNLHDSVFVLLLNDAGGGCEHTKCGFPQA